MINTQYINLNMTPSGVLPVLHCSQYDIGRPLGVVVYDGSAEMDLDDYTVTIEATRTDGTAITAAVTTDENIGAFVTTATMTNKDDLYPAQLVIVDGSGKRVASLPFMMRVVKAAMNENAEPINEDRSLYQQFTFSVRALIADIRDNLDAEARARAAQDRLLQAEIDQLVAPSGEAPSVAEIENARIGADGTTYNTLGAAIRTQVGDLESQIDALTDENAVDFDQITTSIWTINAQNKWLASNGNSKTFEIPDGTISISVTASETNAIIAFLNTVNHESGATPDFAVDYPSRITVSANETKTYAVTAGMNYVYVLNENSSAVSTLPAYVWLNKIKTDTTLTESGVPADSKTVGVAIKSTRIYDEADSISNGKLFELPITGYKKFYTYYEQDNEIVEVDENINGTDYIKCPKYLVLCFDPDDTAARVIVYFYTKSDDTYALTWEYLDLTASTGAKNLMRSGNSHNRVIPIDSDDVYVRIANSVEGNVHVFGWTGEHFGCEISGMSASPTNDTYMLEPAITSGYTGITIPGNARFICMKNHMMRNLWGVKGSQHDKIFDSMYMQSAILPEGYDYFVSRIFTNTIPQAGDGIIDNNAVMFTDFSDDISVLTTYSGEKPSAVAYDVIKRAKQLADISWVCRVNNLQAANSTNYFKSSSKFYGIPYMSRWTKACFLGWHISSHTFVNAANDTRSVFYREHGRQGGPGYGLVCSSFGTLVCGFPYPLTNYCFSRDPKCTEYHVNKPFIGMVDTNNTGHCLVPETYGYGSGFDEYTLYEQVSPLTRRTTNYSFIKQASNATRQFNYLNGYVYSVAHKNSVDGFNNAYDLNDNTIVNGTARPYRGDRCVFTSNDTIKINIKDSTATTCYYQTCTYDSSSDTFTLTGSPQSTTVLTDDSYYSVIDKGTLTDGFYAVWTNIDSTKEYFEYHTAPVCTYSMTTNNFSFVVPGNSFWYALFWEEDTPSSETEIIPYIANGDYSEYRKVYNPNGVNGYIFFKGTLGAYVANLTYSS